MARPFDRHACLGFYHRRHGGAPAFIELVVDNTVAGWPALVFAFSAVRDLILARVLFPELGHHLDGTVGAGAPTGEAAAEDRNRRLARACFRRHYWWLRPFVGVFRPVAPWMRRRNVTDRERTRA